MPGWSWIRDSAARSRLVAAIAYLLALLVAVAMRRAGRGTPEAELGAALVMGSALVLGAALAPTRSFPRWSLVGAACVLAAGMLAPLVLGFASRTHASHAIDIATYGWLYLMLLSGARAGGPRWCHSPWVAIVTAAVLATLMTIAHGLS